MAPIRIALRLVVLFGILILSCDVWCFGQNWDGKVSWLYEQSDFFEELDDLRQIHKTGDTILRGREAVILSEYYKVRNDGNPPTHVKDHIVENREGVTSYYDQELDSFMVMYDFNLHDGDTLFSYCPWLGGTVRFRVAHSDSIEVIDGWRGIQLLDAIDDACTLRGFSHYTSLIIDGVGSLEYAFPRPGFVDPPPGGDLWCYSENGITYPEYAGRCDLLVSNNVVSAVHEIRIFPSPTSGPVLVEGVNADELVVYNMTGQTVTRSKGNAINISDLQTGTYALHVVTPDAVFVRMIVKTGQ